MAENSKIEWCNHTFNPWMGCTKVAAGCAHCYAEELMDRRYGKAKWGQSGTRTLTAVSNWKQPVKWNREAAEQGKRFRVFCASLADVYEDWEGQMNWADGKPVIDRFSEKPYGLNDARRDLFALIDATPNLDWLLLTKRPENIGRFWPLPHNGREPLDPLVARRDNVWLGTSIATQEDAEKNIRELLRCRDLAPVLFLSAEPLLGPIDFLRMTTDPPNSGFALTDGLGRCDGEGPSLIDWVICGGESGHGARPMHPDWARGLRDQCAAAGVPFFFKQWGEHAPWDSRHLNVARAGRLASEGKVQLHTRMMPDGTFPQGDCTREEMEDYMSRGVHMIRVGKGAAGRELDGRTWDEFPQVAATV